MPVYTLSLRIRTMTRRLADLRERVVATPSPPSLLRTALAELEATAEELRVVHEGLHSANDELVETCATAQHERSRYNRLFAAAPAAYVATTTSSAMTEVNLAAATLLGADSSRLCGKPLALFVVPKDRPSYHELVHQLQTRSESVIGRLNLRPLSSAVAIECDVRAAADRDAAGRVCGYLWMFADRSTQDRASEVAELDDEAKRKDEFLAMLAHELRNPLAPVRAAVEVWRQHGDRLTEQERSWTLEVVRRQADHLAYLLDDLLDVSGASRGKITLRRSPVDLREIAAQAHDAVRAAAQMHRVTISSPGHPVLVDADPTRLRQVVVNLLDNALKYTPRGGNVWLRIASDPRDGVLVVRDDGVGIAPDMLEALFGMFHQGGDGLGGAQGGLGLGLALVRRLVELHGGTVAAHSEGDGRGSEFVVRLPRLADEHQLARTSDEQRTELPTLHMLVADDNVDAAEMLAMLLVADGHRTTLAFDGIAAIEAFERTRPDVVLLDLGLPDIDGFQVAAHLRKLAPNIPVVAITGHGSEDIRARTREGGFAAHVVKPVDVQSLRRTLVEIFSRISPHG
jgi:PAS domain S-box-containing protein